MYRTKNRGENMRTIGKKFEEKLKKPTKKEVITILKEKEIPYDEKASVDELMELIQEE